MSHHRLGDEGQRPLGAHQDVGEDVDRPLEVDEGVEPVPGGVLHPVLRADARGHERRSRADLVAELQQSACSAGSRPGAPRPRPVGAAVDHGSGGQDEGQRVERVVAVLLDPAAHPARVVGQDAAQGAGADARRVGADLPPEQAQELVQVVPDHPRAGADAEPVLLHARRPPVPRHLHQEPVGERLAGEARSGGAEGERNAPRPAEGEQPLHLVDRAGEHHRLGQEPVEACIRGERHAIQRSGEDPFGRGATDELVDQVHRGRKQQHRVGPHGAHQSDPRVVWRGSRRPRNQTGGRGFPGASFASPGPRSSAPCTPSDRSPLR